MKRNDQLNLQAVILSTCSSFGQAFMLHGKEVVSAEFSSSEISCNYNNYTDQLAQKALDYRPDYKRVIPFQDSGRKIVKKFSHPHHVKYLSAPALPERYREGYESLNPVRYKYYQDMIYKYDEEEEEEEDLVLENRWPVLFNLMVLMTIGASGLLCYKILNDSKNVETWT